MSANLPHAEVPASLFADKLTIETPEQTALDFVIAGIGSRFLALGMDMLIQGGIIIGGGIVGGIGVASLSHFGRTAPLIGTAVLILMFFVVYFGYFAFFEIIWNGQTPGKRKAGIRVIKDSGRPLTPAESIGRNLMRIVDWMPSFYAVGIVSALLTKESKRLGDLVVGSIVVRERSFDQLKSAWLVEAATPQPGLAIMGAIHLSPGEHAVIDSFLSRRFDLEPIMRFRMADEILRRIKPKLTLPLDNTLSSEKILEALAYERRTTIR